MIIQKLDVRLVEYVLWYRKQFGHFTEHSMKCGALFYSKENPLYKQRSSCSQYYDRRVFVYGQSTGMYPSNVRTEGPCNKGMRYEVSRMKETNISPQVYKL